VYRKGCALLRGEYRRSLPSPRPPRSSGGFQERHLSSCVLSRAGVKQTELLRMSAFAVAIWCKADIAVCAAHVCL
jgi:hypothetical protein